MAEITLNAAFHKVIDSFREAIRHGMKESCMIITHNSIFIRPGTVTLSSDAIEGIQNIREHIESHEPSPLDAFWIIYHSPDCTETGMTQKRSYLKTTWKGFPAQRNCEQQIVEDFCYKRFGSKVDYVQGVCPCDSWTVSMSSFDEFRRAIPQTWGGTPTETRRITLDIGDHGKTVVTSDEIVTP